MTVVGLREHWNSLSRGTQRIVIALALSLDACSGLLYGFGSLNIIDAVLFGSLPTDLVWLLQTLQLICMGFAVVKVFFDDFPHSTISKVSQTANSIALAFARSRVSSSGSQPRRAELTCVLTLLLPKWGSREVRR